MITNILYWIKLSTNEVAVIKQHLNETANIPKTGFDYKGYSVDVTGRPMDVLP